MFYTRGLLLKGILGFGAASAATYGGLTQKERIAGWFSSGEETTKPEASTEEVSKLLENVGLECQNLDTATAEVGVVCSKKTGDGAKNIKVKREGSTEFNVSTLPSDSGGGKIKVYKVEDKGENGYASGLKLVIEEGNINGGDGNNKLEEFETYEIKDETNSSNPAEKQYYLNRKTKASDKIKVLLGLDTCTFPEGANASQSCSLTTEQIKKINFEGKDGDVTGTGTLQISIAQSNETQDFPYGFKFTLTPSSGGNINIPRGSQKGALTLTSTNPTVFKIKKSGTSLTLEESLTQEALAKKVGLSCPTEATEAGVDCSKASDGNIKVKQGDSTIFDVSSIDGEKKIKLYKAQDSEGYNKNLKFVIEGGDISGTGASNKLEEFETYEIKEHSGTHYLTRKDKSKDSKRKILGLPNTCTFPESSSTSPTPCSLDSTNINNIKFDGKTSATLTANSGGSATLKVEVTPSTETTDFPHGFKFTLTPASGSTLTINRSESAGAITLESGTPKEFKIKKQDKSLTLEEAWTLTTLTQKVGLSCIDSTTPSATTGVNCTKTGSTNIKVKKAENTNFEVSTISEGKIKVYKTSAGEAYNEGFKFVIEENDINGTDTNKLEQFETYEIKKDGTDWKLNRKTDAKAGIKKALGLPEDADCDLPTNGSEKTCNLDETKFKKIKFDGKNEGQMTGGGSTKLKISKPSESENSDYGPFGYKFVFESTNEAKISETITIAGKTNTEFKIKRQTNSNNITLEKAWTAESLGKKINLTCTTNGNNNECSLDNGKNINVKDGNNTRKQATFKNGEGSGNKKLTFAEGAEGHNQGIKFTTSEEICLENGDPSGSNVNIIANNGTTYEIKKDGDDWFLIKKSAPAA